MGSRVLIHVLLVNLLQGITGVPHYSHQNFFTDQCTSPNFRCYDEICIPFEWVCDGKEDCLNGEDEYCIKEDPIQIADDRQFRKRSPNLISEYSQLNNQDIRNDAFNLIFNANRALERGVNHIPDQFESGKRVFKRNQDELYVEEEIKTRIETENPVENTASDATSTEQSTISLLNTIPSSTFMISSSTSSKEEISSSTETPISTTLTSSTLDDFITLIESDITQTSEGPTEVTSDMSPDFTDLFEERLMLIDEIISRYLVLKQWLEKVLNKTQDTSTNCPTLLTTPIPTESNTSTTTTEATTTTATISKKPDAISKVTCPYHFQFMNGICIFVQIYPPVSWFEAAALCNAQYSTLIQINSKEFFEKLLKQLNFDKMRVYDFWIGATNHNINGQWSWTDGSPITNFDVWGFNLDKNNLDLLLAYNKPNQCGFLDGKLYSYVNEASCYEPKGFICQFRSKYQEVYYYTSNVE